MSDSEQGKTVIRDAMIAQLRKERAAVDFARFKLIHKATVLMEVADLSMSDVCEGLGISERTWFRWLKEFREQEDVRPDGPNRV